MYHATPTARSLLRSVIMLLKVQFVVVWAGGSCLSALGLGSWIRLWICLWLWIECVNNRYQEGGKTSGPQSKFKQGNGGGIE